MMLEETYTLSNGVEIPRLGLGTWFISDDDAAQAVRDAVHVGYRHIDTAQAYRNEAGVGEGIATSGVARDELFVTTKLAAEAKSYTAAADGVDESLKTMGLDYIDLMIIHSPQPWSGYAQEDRHFEGNREAWRALEDAYRDGKLRAVGVSNFESEDIENILGACDVPPMVDQVLAHIGHTPTGLIAYARDKDILIEAHSPIAHGGLIGNAMVAEMAERYGVSVPRLSIRYALQLGLLPIPKTANRVHMQENADVDFVILDEDMKALLAVEHGDYGDAARMPVYAGRRVRAN